MIIDVHAHLNDEKLKDNITDIISNLNNNNVEKVINAGCDLSSCKKVLKLATENENLYCVLGMHPEFCEEYNSEFEEFLKQNLTNNKVVGIGEIGLDYYWVKDNKEIQKQVFISQIKLANEFKLPIVVHLRDAYQDALEIFKKYKEYLTNGVCLHCFSGSVEFYKEIEKLGFYVSLGGSITFKNNKKSVELLKVLNKNKFMLETDCPYLAPEPLRGTLNEPKNIKYVALKFANEWLISPEEVVEIAKQNSLEFFKKLRG